MKSKTGTDIPFWKRKTLHQLSGDEWESLCDGCGKCCLHKVIVDENVFLTTVACRLLDLKRCSCTRYSERRLHVPECLQLDPDSVKKYDWLPETCAYRLLDEGKDLPSWHPLVTGDRMSTIRSGMSVSGLVIPEGEAKDLLDHVIQEF